MVLTAERNLIVHVGATAVFPVIDVVDLAVMEADVAIGYRARRVDRFECAALVDGGQPA